MTKKNERRIPDSDSHDALRGHLLALYAGMISAKAAPDNYCSAYLGRFRDIRGGARGFLGAASFALLRNRLRTIAIAATAFDIEYHSLDTMQLAALFTRDEEAIYAILRWFREDLGATPREAIDRTAAAVRKARIHDSTNELPLDFSKLAKVSDTIGAAAAGAGSPTLKYSLAPELVRRWSARFSADLFEKLARSMTQPAPLDIRVNGAQDNRDILLRTLHDAGIEATASSHAPCGIRLIKKMALSRVPGIESGDYAIQDEGSQLVGQALFDLPPGSRILDACAGAGGKSLQLANAGMKVFAHDISSDRLEKIRERSDETAANQIEIISPETAASHGPYDAVLIDAPCAGLGRLRREPALVWMAPIEQRLVETAALQRSCLAQYAPLVKPGGIVVYATCSFEHEETDGQIDGFLAENKEFREALLPSPFEGETFEPLRSTAGGRVTLLPPLHGTDGFFIARMRRDA